MHQSEREGIEAVDERERGDAKEIIKLGLFTNLVPSVLEKSSLQFMNYTDLVSNRQNMSLIGPSVQILR